ncbi:FKBP-type peptidyl-prolyl cis-trans isomerase [Colletotrichum scovillei]|uniref:FK506-binding protein n=2 Tax=Colletotrichum acutatum species complex TaxID=2707335 RepID=A0A9P7QUX1_9PEZI|nr:FKBP-type peptidyl-prolyl cis-trans isomerase [Colletotrichum scovillei]KXH38669.1 FKBP-type peptidyl-prolyl cis-trans isomerase [Colletotrichum nymphaeae SA-01]KAF4775262.1 FKBP-type peptidyl-prolyl cis-trans isomerase [Colletotrichum scovillei]KAG7043018.1 fk506-binding protein 4 [Colletotrichum scovillei]KAG7043607.1 fk506-binding protein 4 [Colletotrichum scovillei]KAG7063040.1 fk506-binding protein 4 [Colletotrichum scovillei]
MAQLPVALYGLEVPAGEILIPANPDFPATFRITMAAIDPSEAPEADADGNIPAVPRSTLRLVKQRFGDDLEAGEDEEIDEDYLQSLIDANGDDDESSDDDDEPNGGPSDPSKSKKQKQAEALKKLIEAVGEEESDEEMDDAKPNGKSSKKGKGKASDDDEEDDEESDDDEEGLDLENFVICTLDTERNYQQPLDITVQEGEKVFFVVSGTHTVHLTGNYVIDDEEEEGSDEDEDDDEYDLSPDELEYGMPDEDSDDLDDTEDPRVMEVDTDEEEAPKLVETSKKGKKRAAESLDDLIKADDETKTSKKDKKKLKNNKGEAVAAEEKTTPKSDKKVQFAKNLEQGPTGSAEKAKQAGKPAGGVKVVQGVTIDDRKPGTGRAVKNGDSVSVRYIGKLDDGKVFDANKKGKPFTFKAGKGQVIKGWDIGVIGMAIGGERRLTIPANLAYGNKSLPGIPAKSTLTFDVKLLEIK